MKLYYYPLSTYSQKVLLALYEKELHFSADIVDLMDSQSCASFENIYAIGRVPLLQLHGPEEGSHDNGRIIPESSIIIDYLDSQFPDSPQLIPDSPDEARIVRFMDRMCDLYLNDPIAGLVRQKIFGGIEKEMPDKKAFKYIDCSYEYLDQHLAERQFICGDSFSLADCACIPALFYARYIYPFAEHEHIRAYWLRAMERSSVQKVLSEVDGIWQPLAKELFPNLNIVD